MVQQLVYTVQAALDSGQNAGSVLVVGTNTLRKAKRKGAFLERAREALGHPIEIVSGQEEVEAALRNTASRVSRFYRSGTTR